MGKQGFYVSKALAVVFIVLGLGALATIIALSVPPVTSNRPVTTNPPVTSNRPVTTNPPVTSNRPVTTAAPSNEPWDQYRLPKSLEPTHYSVTLHPRLKAQEGTGLYIFTGESSVDFHCKEETDLILIHSNKLNYTSKAGGEWAELTVVSGADTAPTITESRLQTETQYLVLTLDRKLTKNAEYRLTTTFTGELADDLGGFYRSEYVENGQKKVIATTQMQPTDARKAFPCFDEPALKATFDITLIHDAGTVALSNASSPETIEGNSVMRTVFERTPKMSTYLLAFIVSEFGNITDTVDDVTIKIYARKPAIDAGQGDYALKITGPILKFFENYYNSSYPLPKSDQIALPDFNAGAMENWGLITYRETALLYDPEFSSNSNKERIATIIAHELAHMWFGNLVTLRWWNDLWLNEGFASYVEYLGADNAEPDWGLKDLIVLNDIHRVFAVDALASSHPLSSPEDAIQKPAQISELFDAISYSKGASVLRMLSDFLTEPVFLKGLQTYLQQFAFGNTVYTDLWNHLEQAVQDLEFNLPFNVTDIMNTWVLQMGFPVVTVDTTTGIVTQKHFLLNPDSEITTESPFEYKWIVPIKWQKNGAEQPMEWLREESETKPEMKLGGSDWVLLNLNMSGYYRVNYDDGNWDRLLNTLSNNHEAIPVINRAQLVDDAFNLARAKIIPTVRALSTTKYLTGEMAYMPWKSAINNLEFFFLMFDRSEVFGPMQKYLQRQVQNLFTHYNNATAGYTADAVGHQNQYTQVNAFSLACRTGLTECQNLASTLFKDWMATGVNKIRPNLRTTVYCNAIAAGGVDVWDFAWGQFQKATIATEAEKIRYALTCTKESWLLNRYLEYTLNPTLIRKQDATSTIIYIAENVVGQNLAWDFIRARWPYIFSQYGGGSFSFSNLINGVTERFSTEYELHQLEQFKADHAEVGFGSGTLALEQSIERTKGNIEWLKENKQTVLEWFQKEVSASPSS
uniref:Aminopeptidase n=1 Tax=Salarias fasciatus TaxID=181472 RepID=A0A672HE93_SALFA